MVFFFFSFFAFCGGFSLLSFFQRPVALAFFLVLRAIFQKEG